jgi:ATP-binding cassette subfamily B protein RaxB
MSQASLNFSWRRRVKLVLQAESSECGLACLTMIANFHGDERSLDEIRKQLKLSNDGVNLKQLMKQALEIGLTSRALKLDMDELNKLSLPSIIHWDFNHFVVLTKVTKTQVTIIDPAMGKRVIAYEELSKHFTGIALELSPSPAFEKIKASEKLSLSHFIRNVTGLKRHLLLLLGLSILLQATLIAGPFYMQSVIDLVVVDNDKALLKVLALGFGLLLIFEIITQYMREKIGLHFASRLNLTLSSGVFEHLLKLPTTYFNQRHMGDIVSRFASLQSVRELITSGIVTAFIDGLMAIVTLIVMALYSIKLTLIVIAVVLAYALIRWVCFTPMQRLSKESIQLYANENAYFMQTVRAIKTVKLSAKEAHSSAKWSNRLTLALNKDIRIAVWTINLNSVNKALFGIENLVVVFIAALLVLDTALTVGMLFAFMSYKSRFVGACDGLINMFIQFKMLDVHLSRLSDIVKTAPEFSSEEKVAENYSNIVPIHTNEPLLKVDNLCFAYSSEAANLLDEVSFSIEPGQSVALVGKSGCGKSTLMQCLLGLIQPNSGQISYSGRSLKAHNRHTHGIAAVLQEDQLLNGSILQNISDFDEKVNIEQVVKMAQIACLHDDIMQMTMQYESLIGDMGDSLSGGQRQRLLLARALYKQPKILMLDEATSHLDGPTEVRINEHLQQLQISKVIIAHRQESIRLADKVIEIKQGKAIEVTGTYFTQQQVQQH